MHFLPIGISRGNGPKNDEWSYHAHLSVWSEDILVFSPMKTQDHGRSFLIFATRFWRKALPVLLNGKRAPL